jgi:hypothetical protein
MPRALDWYDYCLKRNPTDGTAVGATITIRERYMPAWRLLQEKRYDEALVAIEKWIQVEPNGQLGLHMKGTILEQAGRTKDAYVVWKLAADTSALDAHAAAKVDELAQKLGIETPVSAQYIFKRREMKVDMPRD